MKASEIELADVNLLMKKIKASFGQSMKRKRKDRTEDRWYKRGVERKSEQTENEAANSKCKDF